jgi:Holliday junction resolvase RusA-like endonuclease
MLPATSPVGGAPLDRPAPPTAVPQPPLPLADAPVSFTVYGVPVTQAGMRSVPTPAGYRQVTVGGKGLLPWRQAVARAAREAAETGGAFGDQPVVVTLDFRFPMPKARTKAQRARGVWYHLGRRDDIDKLERAMLDGLTEGGLIADDGNVVEVHKRKREYSDGWLGCDVAVRLADLAGVPL